MCFARREGESWRLCCIVWWWCATAQKIGILERIYVLMWCISIALPNAFNLAVFHLRGGEGLCHFYPMSFSVCFLLVTSKENGKLEALPSLDDLTPMGKGGKLETLPLFTIHH
eukprot:13188975-Ditylum_brightwellii.AAC.1